MTVVPWHAHLSTKADDALRAHRHTVAKYSQLEERLAELQARGESVPSQVRQRLHHKVSFEQARAHLLTCARLHRPLAAFALLPGYFEYAKGFRSVLRDLAHAVPDTPSC